MGVPSTLIEVQWTRPRCRGLTCLNRQHADDRDVFTLHEAAIRDVLTDFSGLLHGALVAL